jgi:hypothetical protein
MENNHYFLLQITGDLVHQPADLREQPCLNGEVVDWCLTNCKGKWDYRFNWYAAVLADRIRDDATIRKIRKYKNARERLQTCERLQTVFFVMEFEDELDRLHFKLRWLG